MAKPKSQPRKPKEPLIPEAEIPRPKLSEDELMALFYAGKVRPGATIAELEETYQALTTGSPHSVSFVKEPEPPPQAKPPSPQKPFSREPSRGEPPFRQEPFLKEPSPKKPFLEEPSSREPSLQEGLLSCQEVPPEQFGEVLQQAFDLLPSLKPFEQLFYIWFLKLSYGIGRNYCRVRMGLLQRATRLSEKVVRETIRTLIGKRCLTLLDGGSAGRASLYHVAKPKDAISLMKGSPEKPFSQEHSLEKGSHEIPAVGNLSAGIRERVLYTNKDSLSLSSQKPFPGEPSPQEPFLLVPVESLLDRFYSLIGQIRISRQKRERGREQLLDLLQQGFSLDDISFAIEWVKDHLPGQVHSFGIIPQIIGQALKDREEARRMKEQLDRARAREVAEERRRVAEEATRRRIEEVKASLPPETLEELNQEASRLLEETSGARHAFGQELLLKMKVDELIKERYLESS